MATAVKTVEEYLESLPEDRRAALSAVREVILKNLGEGYEEGIQYGMIAYYVPHSVYPKGYHCNPKEPVPYLCLGSQKTHMVIHALCIYRGPSPHDWLEEGCKAPGKKPDMGKGCVRFKKLQDVPLEVVGELVARTPLSRYLAAYEAAIARPPGNRPAKEAASE